MLSKIGIRPVIDGRQFGIRESLEVQTMNMAKAAAELISSKVRHASGEPMECVIADTTIGGIAESAACADKFATENIVATLTVTPCWCYVTQVIDENPNTIKAVWGFNGTERPGAVFLAAANSAYAQIGMPCFSIYGHDVKDADDTVIPSDVEEKILRFARCAAAVGDMKNKSYVNIGSQAMGIAGAYCNEEFFRDYLGIHPEWVDMTEIIRREKLGIYDEAEYKKALAWIKEKCPEGVDINPTPGMTYMRPVLSAKEKEENWEFIAKMTCIIRDILKGNPKLAEMGWLEESKGRNAVLGGFQGQRMWTDFMPNADFTEAILNTTFDWNGAREPIPFATENDTLNGTTLMFLHLLTGRAAVFADVRTYWSPDSVKRVTGWTPNGGKRIYPPDKLRRGSAGRNRRSKGRERRERNEAMVGHDRKGHRRMPECNDLALRKPRILPRRRILLQLLHTGSYALHLRPRELRKAPRSDNTDNRRLHSGAPRGRKQDPPRQNGPDMAFHMVRPHHGSR